MTKITQEDLMRYLYKETSERKTADIKAALESDWNLREKFEKLISTQENLNEIRLAPRPEVVNRILEYAANKQGQLHSL